MIGIRGEVLWVSSTVQDELILLGLAFVLCGAIGVERQLSQKSAGVRTHLLVGMGSAGFTLISAYGFAGVDATTAIIDPSRIAAQIVSGIGFLGAGVIFMRRDVVRGLTTAATIWLTAAVGMACGAGLVVLAASLTVLHIAAVTVVAPLTHRLRGAADRATLTVRYLDGRGVLRGILTVAADMGYQTTIRSTEQIRPDGRPEVIARMQFRGRPPLQLLMAELSEVAGVERVAVAHETE